MEPPDGVTPLPIIVQPTGVLFRIVAPGHKDIFLTGSFNGWGTRNGLDPVIDPKYRMYGPYEDGLFEFFAPVPPGSHAFCYNLGGRQRIYGHDSLPRAQDVYKGMKIQGKYELKGSVFDLALTEPPWPAYISNDLMSPVLIKNPNDKKSYLRVRYFTRMTEEVHIVGSWDSWANNASIIDRDSHRMRPTRVPNAYEYYIPVLPGQLEYKIVLDNTSWIADPSVKEVNPHGNTIVRINFDKGQLVANFTPRFALGVQREEVESRWGDKLRWVDDRNIGFSQSSMGKKRLLWVVTVPGSVLTEELMERIHGDGQLVAVLDRDFICLETPAHEVRDIIERENIRQLPYVVLVDQAFRPVWHSYAPDIATIKKQIGAMYQSPKPAS